MHEFGALVQFGNAGRTGIAHSGAQATDKLMHHLLNRAFERNLPLLLPHQ